MYTRKVTKNSATMSLKVWASVGGKLFYAKILPSSRGGKQGRYTSD